MKKIGILIVGLMVVSAFLIPAKAYAVNLAAGMPVTVNEFTPGFPGFPNATDGNLNNWWQAEDHGTTVSPNWLYVDLGAIFNINRIKLVGGYNGIGSGTYGYKNFFQVAISTNGSTWTDLYSGILTDDAVGRFDDRTFSPLSAQYVRYAEVGGDYIHHPTLGYPGVNWSNLAEMKVYDTVIPEPATLSLLGLGLLGIFGFKRRIGQPTIRKK